MTIKDYFIKKKQQIRRKTQMLEKIKKPYPTYVNNKLHDSSLKYFGQSRKYKNEKYPLDNTKNYIILHIDDSYYKYYFHAYILDIDTMKTKANFEDCLFIVYIDKDSKWCEDNYRSMRDNPDKFCGCLIESKKYQLNFKLDDSAFDRARRIVKILETQANIETNKQILDCLTKVYDNTFYLVVNEIQNQYMETPETFQNSVYEDIVRDLYYKMPLNQFIDKWESWSENNKATIEAEKEKLKQQKQEGKRQKEAKELAEKTELCEYMKL